MVDAEHDPDFELDEPTEVVEQQDQAFGAEEASNNGQEAEGEVPKPKKKKKRRVNKQEGAAAAEGPSQPAFAADEAQSEPEGAVDWQAPDLMNLEQPAKDGQQKGEVPLPNIFETKKPAEPAQQFQEVGADSGMDGQQNLEISDGEVDVEEAKRNLRSQAENKRLRQKQKKAVAGQQENKGEVPEAEMTEAQRAELEISDGEVDVEEAKRNLRSQAEQKRNKQKAVVMQRQQSGTPQAAPTKIVQKEDLEISDGEVDVEEAKRNLRSQAESKRKQKKAVVMKGVANDQIEMSNLNSATPGQNQDKWVEPGQAASAEEEKSAPHTPKHEEVKLPPIGRQQHQIDASEAMARQLQEQFDAEAAEDDDDDDEESEDAEEIEARNRRRNRGKKGRRRARRDADNPVANMNFNYRDNEDISLQPMVFSREHFRRLVKKTFDDYYPLEYNRSTFNMDEYLAVVGVEQLETKFAVHLEVNDTNVLTLNNMPWLDLGELPVSYNTHKSEAFQVYLIPHNELPDNLVVTFDNWNARYDHASANKFYAQTRLSELGIAAEDVEETLRRASELVSDYRGALARRNKKVKIILFTFGALCLFLAVLVGMLEPGNYWGPMLIVMAYLMIFMIVITVFKYRSSYQMRMSQFLLSVYCRAENNRLYLRRGVEVRPGFLGKWIEFTCLQTNNVEEMVQQMRQRFLKPCLEQKAIAFDKHIMSQADLVKEQRDIESQMFNKHADRDAQEMAEVAQAALESNPNEFSQENELSMQAMAQNANSQAALGVYEGQPDGLPPPVVDRPPESTPGQKKKKGKRKKKRDAAAKEADAADTPADQFQNF